MNEIIIKVKGDNFKLYIDDLLHLYFNKSDLKGVQSWKEGRDWFKIEYTFKDTTILTAYDNQERWELILKEIDKYL